MNAKKHTFVANNAVFPPGSGPESAPKLATFFLKNNITEK